MKKLLVVLLLILMVGCTNETETPDNNDDNNDTPPIEECLDTELDLDGECISVEGYQLNLHQALVQTQELKNYTVSITITNNLETLELLMEFDDDLIHMTDPNQEQYITITNDECTTTTITSYDVNTDTSSCDLNPMIHHTFFYDQFSISSGRYQLDTNSISEVIPYFSSVDQADISNLTLSLQDGYIYDIDATLFINNIEHQIHMEYKDITNTTVVPYTQE